jgi:hypothetical protein
MSKAKTKVKMIQGEGWEAVAEAVKTAKAIAYEGCHKIYLAMDDEQVKEFRRTGYGEDETYLFTSQHFDPDEMLALIKGWYEKSCGLRMIDAVYTDTTNPNAGFVQLIPQFWDEIEEDTDEDD